MNTPKLILAECRNWFEDVQSKLLKERFIIRLMKLKRSLPGPLKKRSCHILIDLYGIQD